MLSKESVSKLRTFLMAVGEGERATEAARQRLCRHKDYMPHTAFERIDLSGKNFIGRKEILTFLKENNSGNTTATKAEVDRLVEFFDVD